MGAHALHFRIEIIEVVQHERLGEHGQLRRSKLVFAVMTDDEVLEQGLQLIGEIRNQSDFSLQHFKLNDHVAEKLAAAGVRKRTVIAELVNFSDIVQERAGEQQIAIDLRVIAAKQ